MPTHIELMDNFDQGLRSGVLYPRWMANVNYGYGVPTTLFYPPATFYLSSLIHLFTGNWTATVFALCVVCLFASGLTFYWLARQFYGRLASVVAAFLYMLFPYHLLDLYYRGALPEFAGFVLMPMIVYFFIKVGKRGKLNDYAGLGLFYGLHLLTHLPVSYMFTYALAFYALVWAVSERDWRLLLRLAAGMSLGLLLSAIYWLPAALESQYAHDNVTEIFPYDKSYLALDGKGDEFIQLVEKIFVFQGVVLAVAIVITVLLIRWRPLSESGESPAVEADAGKPGINQSAPQIALWSLMAIIATLMNTQVSMPVATRIPKVAMTVPAWRWMAIASLFIALLVGAAIEYSKRRKASGLIWLWGARAIIFAVLLANLWLTTKMIREKLGTTEYVRMTEFTDDGFVPKDAALPRGLPKTERAIVSPIGTAEVLKWQPQYREVEATANSKGTLRLKTYNFPGWQATLDGEPVPILSDPNGTQVIRLPAGTHKVTTKFTNTPPRILGAILFWIGLLTIIGLTVIGKRRAKAQSSAAD